MREHTLQCPNLSVRIRTYPYVSESVRPNPDIPLCVRIRSSESGHTLMCPNASELLDYYIMILLYYYNVISLYYYIIILLYYYIMLLLLYSYIIIILYYHIIISLYYLIRMCPIIWPCHSMQLHVVTLVHRNFVRLWKQ